MGDLAKLLAAAVSGDLGAFVHVMDATHESLRDAASRLSTLVLKREALATALRAWRTGEYSDALVQGWASFVRRGYVSGRATGIVEPIDVEYFGADEELIVEIIGRLDELGDVVDGTIDKDELDGLIKRAEA